MSGSRLTVLILMIGLILAGALRLMHIGYGLPFLYFSDEGVVARSAVRFFSGDLNPHRFDWPHFPMYLMAVEYAGLYLIGHAAGWYTDPTDFWLSYEVDPTPFHRLGRITTCCFSLLTILLLFRLVLQVTYHRSLALAAAAWLAVNPLHTDYSRRMVPEMLLLLLITLSLIFLERIVREDSLTAYLGCGTCIGLGIATKYMAAAVMLLPFLATHWIYRPGRWVDRLGHRGMWLGLTAVAVAFLCAMPYACIDLPSFVNGITWQSRHMRIGHLGFDVLSGGFWVYFIRYLPEALGWGLAIWGSVGVALALLQPYRRPLPFLCALFTVAYLVVFSLLKTRFPRYLLPLMVPWTVVSVELVHRLNRSSQGVRLIAVLLVPLLGWQPLRTTIRETQRLGLPNNRTRAYQWIVSHLPPSSPLVFDGYGPLLWTTKDIVLCLRDPDFDVDVERLNAKLQGIPVYQGYALPLNPHEYDLDRLRSRGIEYVVISEAIRSRHRQNADNSQVFLTFYRRLTEEALVIADFPQDGTVSGSCITVYQINETNAVAR